MATAPVRAHTFICKIGADTAEDLAHELRHFADELMRGQLTVGTIGGASVGSIYSYRVAPEQTHDKYFAELDEWLEEDRRKTASEATP